MLPAVMPGRAEVCTLVIARGHAVRPARIRTAASIAPSDLFRSLPQKRVAARHQNARLRAASTRGSFPWLAKLAVGSRARNSFSRGGPRGFGFFTGGLG